MPTAIPRAAVPTESPLKTALSLLGTVPTEPPLKTALSPLRVRLQLQALQLGLRLQGHRLQELSALFWVDWGFSLHFESGYCGRDEAEVGYIYWIEGYLHCPLYGCKGLFDLGRHSSTTLP